jgi:SAM-dependent methyltransferase
VNSEPACRTTVSWGTHRDFADLYDYFLEAVYPPREGEASGSGRWRLMRSVAAEIRERDAYRVLDCAAGTGFPALDLAADTSQKLIVHCTDGDRDMIDVLMRRAAAMGFDVDRLAPPRSGLGSKAAGGEALVLDWASLARVEGTYDYVLCRGNSLAYADTWAGERNVAPLNRIEDYLGRIAAKVRPGGHLHIDAPWQLELDHEKYRRVGSGSLSIWEQVSAEADCRQWELAYKLAEHNTIRFRRYSSLLTIDRIETALKQMGFFDTTPFSLAAERPGFGVVIARKPR